MGLLDYFSNNPLSEVFLFRKYLGLLLTAECCSAAVLTVSPHPAVQALPQSAVLAPVAVRLVDGAEPGAATLVPRLLTDGPLEETLAALTAHRAVVPA